MLRVWISSVLLASVAALDAAAGTVVMTQTATRTWVVFTPDGVALDTRASHCQGLPEAIAYAVANGDDLQIEGGGLVGTLDPSVIQCDEPLVFPPMQKFALRTGAITLNFSEMIPGPAITIDSCMMCDMDWSGQIVANGRGPAVLFQPSHILPLDPVTSVVDSSFRFRAVVGQGAARGDDVVLFDFAAGGIDNDRFEFGEVNGTSRAYGLRVTGSGSSSFTGNRISSQHVHSTRDMAVVVGNAFTSRVFGNYWELHLNPGAHTSGLLTHASQDEIHLSVHDGEGPVVTALTLGPGASGNLIWLRRAAASKRVVKLGKARNKIF